MAGTFLIAFDGSAAGLDAALDIDAVAEPEGSVYVLSFDTSGSIGGLVFDDEDLVRYQSGTFSLELDASAEDADWTAADLDAVYVPEPGFVTVLGPGLLLLAGLRRASRRLAPIP